MTKKTTVEPGTVLLGKYIVERVLGVGGMGIVVAARHMELGELFAVKLMLESDEDQAEPIERFLREARSSAKLKSQHAVRVHDVGRLPNGTPYMVMEHLAGQDLRQVLQARGALGIDEAVRFVREACEAVAEAHAVGVVHRDLKPANLFLARRLAGPPIVKVLDFGISKELDPQERVGADLTRTGSLLGSPNYMSPEQMTRIKEVDPRSDIWSLGVVLFHLLTAKLPFQGTVITEVIARVLTEEPPRPTALRPDIPADLEAVVLRCLQKKPDDRYQSVNELVAALSPFLIAGAGLVPVRPTEFSIAETIRREPPAASAPPFNVAPLATDNALANHNTEMPTNRAWGTTTASTSALRSKQGLVAVCLVAMGLTGVGLFFALGESSAPTTSPAELGSASIAPSVSIESAATNVLPVSAAPSASAAPAEPQTTARRAKPGPSPTPARATTTSTSTRKLPGFDD